MKPKRKPAVSLKDVDQNGSKEMPRFVQITAAPYPTGTKLYALDLSGGVWVYIFSDRLWTPLSSERILP